MSGEERSRAHLDGVTAKAEIEQLPTHIKSSTQAESKSAKTFLKNFKKPIDKSLHPCYNVYSEGDTEGSQEREEKIMTNHVAYNTITGEVLACSTANALKRRVARNTAWDVAHGYGYGKWVFTHKGIDGLCAKVRA